MHKDPAKSLSTYNGKWCWSHGLNKHKQELISFGNFGLLHGQILLFWSLSSKHYFVELKQITFFLNLEVERNKTSFPWASAGIQEPMHLDLERVVMCCCIHISGAILSSVCYWVLIQVYSDLIAVKTLIWVAELPHFWEKALNLWFCRMQPPALILLRFLCS